MLKHSKYDFYVGAMIIAGLLALFFLAIKVTGSGSWTVQDTYRITVQFSNVGQLRSDAPVSIAGVRIGRVLKIELDPVSYASQVTLEVDKRYAIPVDSLALILTAGLLGSQYVAIEVGLSEQFIAPGGVIKRTQSATILEKLISNFVYGKVGA